MTPGGLDPEDSLEFGRASGISSTMSRQQMSFQVAYGATERKSKCKSCQGAVETDDLIVGVKSDSMYDPMWYHFRCFWTRCWYRKQMSRHLEDYAELAGFTKLTPEDKQRFKGALDDSTGGGADTGGGGGGGGGGEAGSTAGLKRRSVSEENLVDVSSKRTKAEVLTLPKLSLSATSLLSKSTASLFTTTTTTTTTTTATTTATTTTTGQSDSADRGRCSDPGTEERIVVSETTVVRVGKSSRARGASVTIAIATTDGVSDGAAASAFQMNRHQWRKMRSVFSDVASAVTSMEAGGERGKSHTCFAL